VIKYYNINLSRHVSFSRSSNCPYEIVRSFGAVNEIWDLEYGAHKHVK